MKTLWNFLRKRVPLSAIVYLTLIYLIMLFNLMGVELVVRGTSVEVLRAMLALGVIVGWLLGRTSYKFWLVLVLGLFSGFIFNPNSHRWDRLLDLGFNCGKFRLCPEFDF